MVKSLPLCNKMSVRLVSFVAVWAAVVSTVADSSAWIKADPLRMAAAAMINLYFVFIFCPMNRLHVTSIRKINMDNRNLAFHYAKKKNHYPRSTGGWGAQQ